MSDKKVDPVEVVKKALRQVIDDDHLLDKEESKKESETPPVKLTNTIQYITSWIILSIFVGLFSIPLCGLKTALRIGSVLILVAFAVALISLIVGWFKGSKLV